MNEYEKMYAEGWYFSLVITTQGAMFTIGKNGETMGWIRGFDSDVSGMPAERRAEALKALEQFARASA